MAEEEKAGFITPLGVRPLPNGRCWELLDNLIYKSSGTIVIPKGMMTDFASVPRWLWCVIPPHGRYNYAAVLHDYLYRTQQFPRKEADRMFLEAMKSSGVSKVRRWFMYFGVRLFARKVYKRPHAKRKWCPGSGLNH